MKKSLIFLMCLCLCTVCLVDCKKGKNDPTSESGTTTGGETGGETPTPSGNGQMNGHDYIDLGLSVKWATCNVGAAQPEAYGDYYAWGETTVKSDYSWTTYKYGDGSTFSKYCTDESHGTVDNKTTLEMSDDAARVNWGGTWRIPTEDEWTELQDNCTWTWTTQNDVKGYKVAARNGQSIFIPAAGFRNGTLLYDTNENGEYWTNTLGWCSSSTYNASGILINSSNCFSECSTRKLGQSVRPVCK